MATEKLPDAAGTVLSAKMAEEIRLKSHWKAVLNLDGCGAEVWTLSNPSIKVCGVGFTMQDDQPPKPDMAVAAAIGKAHNESLIHPDAGKVRAAGQKLLHSIRVAGRLEENQVKWHIAEAANQFSEVLNNRKA
jgi:hypothetical protein